MAKVKIASEMVFERHEKKYLLTQTQYSRLVEPLMEHMQQDPNGLHTICSLYFDTDDFLLIRRSLEKPKYKEKLRLRSYGLPKRDHIVFLELKKKLDGITYKRRAPMTLYEAEQAEQYFKYGTQPKQTGQNLEEIGWFKEWYHPMPKVLLFYDRIALYGIGAQAQGSTLTITADGVYEIKGSLSDGQIIVNATDAAKVELLLSGVEITSSENAAIYCMYADDLIISFADGSENTITDATNCIYADAVNEEPNAAPFSKVDMNIGGGGSLTVNANFAHGISSKDDLVIENGNFTIRSQRNS